MLTTILLVVLILALIGTLPNWGYSQGWNPAIPSVLGTVLVVILILYLLKAI